MLCSLSSFLIRLFSRICNIYPYPASVIRSFLADPLLSAPLLERGNSPMYLLILVTRSRSSKTYESIISGNCDSSQ
ncbi:hypothetical protein Y032_0001g171 [Ancylostoma ceylanicum]|uniref:Uncharacterized protein n=1 Tax=Ancylostoma ceylanicum TaxID=53326 RepID=A0A016W2Q1_9BILA|nr:hypothetical protein Y032_0001g171 [Ancylostoma ceylanicum]